MTPMVRSSESIDPMGRITTTHVRRRRRGDRDRRPHRADHDMDGHIDHVLPKDGAHELRAGFVSSDPYELEADNFSAGLLMPVRRSSAN